MQQPRSSDQGFPLVFRDESLDDNYGAPQQANPYNPFAVPPARQNPLRSSAPGMLLAGNDTNHPARSAATADSAAGAFVSPFASFTRSINHSRSSSSGAIGGQYPLPVFPHAAVQGNVSNSSSTAISGSSSFQTCGVPPLAAAAMAAAAAGPPQDQQSLRMTYGNEVASSDYMMTPEQAAAADAEAAAAVGADTRALRDAFDVGGGLLMPPAAAGGRMSSSYPVISAAAAAAGDATSYNTADQQQMHFPYVQQHSLPLAPPLPAAMPPHGYGGVYQKPMGMLNPANWFGKKQAAPTGPIPSPLQVAASRMPERVVWAPRKAPKPTKLHFSPLALLLLLAFLGAAGYYFYVRVAYTLNMGSHTWYGVLVLVVELIGLTAVVPYGMLLPFHTLSSGSKGLPVDDGRAILPPEKRFRVHILVPCYKESLEVITNTVTAALAAEVPPGVTRTLYLCDDGKDPAKAEFIASLGDEAQYVSSRTRAPGEINGKSANLNNCLRNVIFREYEGRAQEIPARELVVVFDADMAARRHFLLKVLEAMWDESISLCLTPQAFSNINPAADIFNNINQQFWQYVLPGCNALGYIACTGTNFCLRARSLAAVGWFPEYTITEDYALSMELKSAGFKGTYLNEYLAVGEAPDEVRNVCRQRSRWTKGHMQIFFSRRCPLINWKLPLIHKILYTNGTWAYFCTILTTLVFLFVPFNSLVFGYHPVAFSYEFAVAATVYLPLNFALMNFVRTPGHLKGQWMASVSNHILAFTYLKAVFNTLLSIVGVKQKAGFKATHKSGGANPISAIKSLGANLMNSMSRANSGSLPTTQSAGSGVAPSPLSAAAAAMAGGQRVAPARPTPMSSKVVVGADGRTRMLPPRPMTKSELIQAELKQQQAAQKKQRRGCWVWINAKTLEGALDPLFLAFSLCVSLAALAAGIWAIIRSAAFSGILVSSWDDFTQIFTSGRLNVYLLVPMLWAVYNAIPPVLFFVYFFTKGRLLKGLCSFAQVFGLVLAAGAMASLWLMIPNDYDLQQVLPVLTGFVDTARSGALPAGTRAAYPWLEPMSGMDDPVKGGFYMAADYVKYSMPIATSMTVLALSLAQFPQGYNQATTLGAARGQLRYGADYLMAAHAAPDRFVVQVGNPTDYLTSLRWNNGSWTRPSDMPRNRTAYSITRSSSGGADAVAAAAAALAATHQAFKDYDPVFAQTALKHAQQLYTLATLLPAESYCQEVVDCYEGIKSGGYKWKAYPSTSVYDDLSLAAAWLFAATGVRSYASDSQFFFTQHLARETSSPPSPTSHISNYDNSAHMAALLLDQLLGFAPAQQHMLDFFKGWMTGLSAVKTPVLFVTPKGLHYLAGHPSAGNEPLPNAAHAAMLALLYAHSPRAQARGLTPFVVQSMQCFALHQVTYALGGQRGKGRSFIVGLGSNPPTRPQHRQASCSSGLMRCTVANSLAPAESNPYVIKGAVVAGPDGSDAFADDRSSEQSRVSVAYNVPFMGTVAGLLQHAVSPANCQKEHGLFQDIFLTSTPGL